MEDIFEKLRNDLPEFVMVKSELDELLYVDYDALGKMLIELVVYRQHGETKQYNYYTSRAISLIDDIELFIKQCFDHIENIFNSQKKEMFNLLASSIYSNLSRFELGYIYSKKYMSEEQYLYFLDRFPPEKHLDGEKIRDLEKEDKEFRDILKKAGISDEELPEKFRRPQD